MKILFSIFCLFLYGLTASAQDSSALAKKLTLNGYIKDMQSLDFNKDFSELLTGNLLHNRINLKWKASAAFSAAAEFRTRFFWGEEVKSIPGFASLMRNSNERLDLQKIWIEEPSMVLLSNTERLYLDFRTEKFNIRTGRQRINWGITTSWNPNDIFNSYNFLDFDYEERPGVDGAKLGYSFNNSSNAEIAYALTGKDESVGAIKYSLNKWNYDIQFITGWYHDNFTLGAGWAGNIKDAGFKGEGQYFFAGRDSSDRLNLSLEGDYMFSNGWYINLSMLFNNKGIMEPIDSRNDLNLSLSPENLMPTKWNLLLTTAKEITPLFSANGSLLYAPGTKLLIIYPSLQYNIAPEIDVNLVWQSFFAEMNNRFDGIDHRCFLRLKASF